MILALAGQALAQRGGSLSFGALLPLSGPLADRGKTSKVALELAQADINAYLAASGASGQFSITVENTAGNPAQAVEKLKSLAGRGIRVVIGPFSDDAAEACLEYADKNNLLLLSQGSAGPFLSKKGDNLFRLAPSDTYQAEAVTSLMAFVRLSTFAFCHRSLLYISARRDTSPMAGCRRFCGVVGGREASMTILARP